MTMVVTKEIVVSLRFGGLDTDTNKWPIAISKETLHVNQWGGAARCAEL